MLGSDKRLANQREQGPANGLWWRGPSGDDPKAVIALMFALPDVAALAAGSS